MKILGKILIKTALLILIEFIILWFCIIDSDIVSEGDSAGWFAFFAGIFAFGANLIIGIVLLIMKNKNGMVLLVNAIALPALIFYVIEIGIDKKQKQKYEGRTEKKLTQPRRICNPAKYNCTALPKTSFSANNDLIVVNKEHISSTSKILSISA